MLRHELAHYSIYSGFFVLLTSIMITGCRLENDISGGQTPIIESVQATQESQGVTITPVPSITALMPSPSPSPIITLPVASSTPDSTVVAPTTVPTPNVQIERVFDFGGTHLTISPDGLQIVVSSDGENIGLYSYETGQYERMLVKSTAPYFRPSYAVLAFSPDSRRLAVSGLEKTVWVWDVASGDLISEFPFFGPASDLAFSPDGQLVAVVSASEDIGEHGISVFDSNTGALIAQIEEGVVATNVVFLKNESQILMGIDLDYRPDVARQDGFMVWDYKANEVSQVLSQYDAPTDIAIDAGRNRLAATIEGKLYLIDLQSFTEIDVESPDVWSRNLDFDDAGNLLALNGNDMLSLWNADGKLIRQQQFVGATDFAVVPETNRLLISFPEEVWEVVFR